MTPQSSNVSDAAILAGARELCKINATECDVDVDDLWKLYSEQFLADARACLRAAEVVSPSTQSQPKVPEVSDADILECAKEASKDVSKLDDQYIAQFLPTWRTFARALARRLKFTHPDTARCIQARNDLNGALHGKGTLIDDLEHAVANICAKFKRFQSTQVTPQERDEAIDAKLAEYNYPANTRNAARAGWYACMQTYGIGKDTDNGQSNR